MESQEYQTLYDLEDSYWWFRGLRAALSVEIRKIKTVKRRALDIGCGTGRNLILLKHEGFHSSGVDISSEAVKYCCFRGVSAEVGSANQVSFPDSCTELILSIDVLECDEVDPEKALSEMYRLLSSEGIAIIIVPAYRWLYSKEHDLAVHAHRRYSRSSLCEVLTRHGFKASRISHLFPTLLPLVVFSRLINRFRKVPAVAIAKSDIKPIPMLINEIFSRVVIFEAFLFRWINFAWGSSIIAVVQKKTPMFSS